MSRSLGAFLVLLLPLELAHGQSDLLDVNEETVVRRVSFDFVDTRRDLRIFTAEELSDVITTKGPRLRHRIASAVGVRSLEAFVLDPIELQRDVVRLRSLYNEAGFPDAHIDYANSKLNAATNRIDIQFTVRQGRPVIIQDVGFFAATGYLAYAFEGAMRDRWIAFRDATSFKTGDRFTAFEVARIEDQVLGWLKDQGYAFAELQTELEVDESYKLADISFHVDPGPIGIITSIVIEGQQQISDRIIRRALPFQEGDLFVQSDLVAAQRALFALNLFSVAQVNVPDQPRDSTVSVLVSVQPARLRHVLAEGGYHQRTGLAGQALWSKRNFLGGGRQITASLEAETGLLAFSSVGAQVSRRLRTSVALGLPQLGSKRFNAIVEPFIQFEQDPLLRESDQFLGFNRRSYGINSNGYIGNLRTRAITIQYRLSREWQFAATQPMMAEPLRDVYDKSVLALSGTLANTDDYLRPTRGWIIRPTIEQSGIVEGYLGVRGLGLKYAKAQLHVTGYIPLGRRQMLTVRASVGRVWPSGLEPVTYYTADGPVNVDAQFAAPFENRYDPVRFYSGGANDVRGWSTGFAGAKINRTTAESGSNDDVRDAFFEPAGGLARLFFSAEYQFPIAGAWHGAAFADAGQVSSYAYETCAAPLFEDQALTIPVSLPYDVQCGLADDGRLGWDQFKVGIGAGLRYDTPIGFIRLDVAVKMNPDHLDLQSPQNAYQSAQGLSEAHFSDWRRLKLHVTVGQPF